MYLFILSIRFMRLYKDSAKCSENESVHPTPRGPLHRFFQATTDGAPLEDDDEDQKEIARIQMSFLFSFESVLVATTKIYQ